MSPAHIGNIIDWTPDHDPGVLEQAAKTSRMPFLAGPLALMPDAHIGIGATIGSVIATVGAVIPAAVGVDIGCGMIAVETDLTADGLPDDMDKLHGLIAGVVPAGMGKGHTEESDWAADRRSRRAPAYTGRSELTTKQVTKIGVQFGSLGSGNHFVEVCLDERTRVWVVLHSGSRGIGNELANVHMKIARKLAEEAHINLEDKDLAWFGEGETGFDAYIADMLWAQDYARANRDEMMDAVLTQLWGYVGTTEHSSQHGVGREVRRINCHHNYCVREHHCDQSVWVTRKGAIRAGVDDLGVIPGSMGTSSYIVRGLGNPASYTSSSHGAGRRMSRGQAKRELTVESLRERMAGKAWNGSDSRNPDADSLALLDEHPDAYKDIDVVMEAQSDLVRIEHTLHQVVNYKGA